MTSSEVLGPPEISDDDTVSVTSTAASETREEYPLEAILAERPLADGKDGELEYLVKWEDYDVTRSTWEPISSFTEDGSLEEWEKQKMRVTRGLEKAFDTRAFEARLAALTKKQQHRRQLRRAKRIERNLPVSPSTSGSEQSDEEEEYGKLTEKTLQSLPQGRIRLERPRASDTIEDNERLLSDRELSRRKYKRQRQVKTHDDEEAGLSDDSLFEECRRKRDKRESPKGLKAAAAGLKQSFKSRVSPPKPSETSKIKATTGNKGTVGPGTRPSTVTRMGPAGRGPAKLKKQPLLKGKPMVVGPAVLGNWNTPVKKRSFPAAGKSTSGVPNSRPTTLSGVNRLQKAGRNEPPPNRDELILLNPNEGGKIVQVKKLVQPVDKVPAKTPHQLIMERQEQAGSSLLSIDAQGSEQAASPGIPIPTSAAEITTKTNSVIAGRQIASPDRYHESAFSPKVFTFKGDLFKNTSAEDPLTQQHNPSPNERQPSKNNSITFAAYSQRQLSAREISGSGEWVPQSECSAGHRDQAPTVTAEDMVDAKSSSRSGLTSLAFCFGEEVGDPVMVGITSLGSYVEAQLFSRARLVRETPLFNFNHAITAEDFRAYYMSSEGNKLFASGDLFSSQESQAYLEHVVETLKLSNSGGLYFSEQCLVLVYPIKMDAWNYLDHSCPPSPKAMLRYQIRSLPNLQLYKSPRSAPPVGTTALAEAKVLTVFREHLGIKYEDLCPSRQKGSNRKMEKVFVICSPTYQDELNLIVSFLEASGATVYTSQTAGAWDYFVKLGETGIVLIHPSFCFYHEIPKIYVLLRRHTTFFHIGVDPNPGASTEDFALTRLFPHGRAILITERLIVKDPAAAKKIVLWFRQIKSQKPAGTCKLVGRPGLREWVLDRAEKSTLEQADLYEIFIALDQMLSPSITKFEDDDDGINSWSPIVSWDPDHHEAEYIKMPNYGNNLDDDAEFLATWFAGWASTKAQEIRRFMIVDPNPAERWMKWHTIEVSTPDKFIEANFDKEK